jgi:hypothetical protein
VLDLTDTMNAVKAKSMEEPAGNHLSTIDWQRGEWTAAPGKYSRQHLWVLAGAKLKASDSGALLPAAYRDKVAINPHNMVADRWRGRIRSRFGHFACTTRAIRPVRPQSN